MHNSESVREKETHKLLWDFVMQMDHLILVRRPDLVIVNKKENFAVPADHRVKLEEGEKRDKYLDLARELKKLWKTKVMVLPIVIGAHETIPKGLVKLVEDLEIREK